MRRLWILSMLCVLCGSVRAANEINAFVPGATAAYGVVRQLDGDVWYVTGQVFEVWGTGGHAASEYDIAMTNKGGFMFVGDMDTNIAAGFYRIVTHQQAGAGPADTDPGTWQEYGYWTGTAWTPTPQTAATIAQAVWEEPVADHTGEATFGGEVGGLDPNLSLVLADTGELQTDWANGGRLDLIIDTLVSPVYGLEALNDQIAAVAGGVSQHQLAESSTVANGTETNTYTATQAHDGVEYIVTDDGAGAGIDFYLQFDIGDGVPTEFHLHGYYDEGTGATNALYIQAYNSQAAAWQTMETLSNAVSEQAVDIGLSIAHVNDGNEVRIRFLQDAEEASSAMHIDHTEVGYATNAPTVAEIAAGVAQSFPANFADLSITASTGMVTPVITWTELLDTVWTGHVGTQGTVGKMLFDTYFRGH